MPNNWKTYKLGELLDLITDYHANGAYKKLKENVTLKDSQDFAAMIRSTNFEKNDFSDLKYIDKHAYHFLAKSKVNPGDVLMNKIANPGTVYFMPNLKLPVSLGMNLFLMRFDESKVIPYYIYKYLKANESYVKSFSAGSVTRTITKEAVKNLDIYLPPLAEQRSIASILSAIDDKIELNLQMNRTLEDMAQALYKHWFVDFGPFQNGEFIDSELGKIPKGWEVNRLGESIETMGGGTPKTKVHEYWKNGRINWYSPTDLTKSNSLFSSGSAKKITDLGLQKSSAKIFPAYSILMSSRATIGAITINRIPACTNQGFITLIPNKDFSIYQLIGWLNSNMDLIISKANGSTFKEISKTNFRNLEILRGGKIDKFNITSKGIFDQVENNLIENQTLTKLRDTLLPKLISGEVRVKDTEKIIETIL